MEKNICNDITIISKDIDRILDNINKCINGREFVSDLIMDRYGKLDTPAKIKQDKDKMKSVLDLYVLTRLDNLFIVEDSFQLELFVYIVYNQCNKFIDVKELDDAIIDILKNFGFIVKRKGEYKITKLYESFKNIFEYCFEYCYIDKGE